MQLLDILETFNYTTNITWGGNVGKFQIDEQQFVMTVRPAPVQESQTYLPFFDNERPNVGNVDFARILSDNTTTQDLTGTAPKSSLKVFSVVAQGVSEQMEKNGFNILLCIAKQAASPTNFKKRINTYEIIVDKIARKFSMYSTKLHESTTETIFVAYTHQFAVGIEKIKQHLNQL